MSFVFQSNIKLSRYSNYKIGGPASYFFEAKTADEVMEAVRKWRDEARGAAKKNIFIFGGGTNLLINDKGYRGLVLKSAIATLALEGGTNIRVGSGVLMSDLLDFVVKNGLSGLEWAGGLPGTVGGAIRGNAGAFGGEIKDALFEVTSVDISKASAGGEFFSEGQSAGRPPEADSSPKDKAPIIKRSNAECKFGYRDSIFKKRSGKEVIVEAVFALKKGESATIARAIAQKINYRKTYHPIEYPNVGSIFKNVPLAQIDADAARTYAEKSPRESTFSLRGSAVPVKNDPFPVVPAAHLITKAGLKGVSCGGALISPKHPNFIVNALDASSDDVKKLIKLVKTQVKKKFGVTLEEEIIYM